MPATTTVTSFVTMVAGTKARASDVNLNFSNFRGHMLPINADTQTSSHNTHDLGATDHYWRKIYLGQAPFINGAQLGRVPVETLMDGSVPTTLLEDASWLTRTAFPADFDSSVRFQFRVPDEYASGNRMSINLIAYAQTGGAHFTLESVSALYKDNTSDASLTSPANVLTSTSNINPPTTSGLSFTNTSLRVTDTSGRINSITVTAGDLIAIDVKRRATATADTNAGYFFLTNIAVDLNN